MKGNSYEAARQVLDNYIEQNNCRKTPERFAILEAVYGFTSYFSLQDLSGRLEEMNFPVSREMIENSLKESNHYHLIHLIHAKIRSKQID